MTINVDQNDESAKQQLSRMPLAKQRFQANLADGLRLDWLYQDNTNSCDRPVLGVRYVRHHLDSYLQYQHSCDLPPVRVGQLPFGETIHNHFRTWHLDWRFPRHRIPHIR